MFTLYFSSSPSRSTPRSMLLDAISRSLDLQNDGSKAENDSFSRRSVRNPRLFDWCAGGRLRLRHRGRHRMDHADRHLRATAHQRLATSKTAQKPPENGPKWPKTAKKRPKTMEKALKTPRNRWKTGLNRSVPPEVIAPTSWSSPPCAAPVPRGSSAPQVRSPRGVRGWPSHAPELHLRLWRQISIDFIGVHTVFQQNRMESRGFRWISVDFNRFSMGFE